MDLPVQQVQLDDCQLNWEHAAGQLAAVDTRLGELAASVLIGGWRMVGLFAVACPGVAAGAAGQADFSCDTTGYTDVVAFVIAQDTGFGNTYGYSKINDTTMRVLLANGFPSAQPAFTARVLVLGKQ